MVKLALTSHYFCLVMCMLHVIVMHYHIFAEKNRKVKIRKCIAIRQNLNDAILGKSLWVKIDRDRLGRGGDITYF